jgi:hypothetical protein
MSNISCPMRRISCSVPEYLFHTLQIIASENNWSVSYLVRFILITFDDSLEHNESFIREIYARLGVSDDGGR